MVAKNSADAPSKRLDASAWVEAGLHVLAAQGIDNVRVEPLAKRLAVTKGSFYWHFKDRDALLDAMLSAWRRRATLQVIERIEDSRDPAPDRLHRLLSVPFRPRAGEAADIELSIRLWGRSDPRARAALEEVDALRLRYIARLIEDLGVPAETSRSRAVLAYAYIRVAGTLVDGNDQALRDQCEEILTGCCNPRS